MTTKSELCKSCCVFGFFMFDKFENCGVCFLGCCVSVDDCGWMMDVILFSTCLVFEGAYRNEKDILFPGWDNEEF